MSVQPLPDRSEQDIWPGPFDPAEVNRRATVLAWPDGAEPPCGGCTGPACPDCRGGAA